MGIGEVALDERVEGFLVLLVHDRLDVDHCFDGWDGLAELRDEQLHVRVRSALTRLVVYTQPTRDVIAIEPVSHVNNAFGLLDAGRADASLLGVRVLALGESMSVEMTIEMETPR